MAKMTTGYLATDSMYPYYVLTSKRTSVAQIEVEMRADVLERYIAAEVAFMAAREELADELNEIRRADPFN